MGDGASTIGSTGLVPAPSAGQGDAVLKGNRNWGKIATDNVQDDAITADKLKIATHADNIVTSADSNGVAVKLRNTSTLLILDLPEAQASSLRRRRSVETNFKVFRDLPKIEYDSANGIGYYPSDSLDADNAVFHNNSPGRPGSIWYEQTQYRDVRPNGDDSYHNVYVVHLYHNNTNQVDDAEYGKIYQSLMYRVDATGTFPLADAFDETDIRGASSSDRIFLGGYQYRYNSEGRNNNLDVLLTDS